MKLRLSYVSNSSSSSYVICRDMTSEGVSCFKLEKSMYPAVAKSLGVSLSESKDWYVTRFLTYEDDSNGNYDKLISGEHYIYMDGEMSGNPYMTDDGEYAGVEVTPGIWMYNTDIGDKVVTRSELLKLLPKRCKFLYKVESDGCIKLVPQS